MIGKVEHGRKAYLGIGLKILRGFSIALTATACGPALVEPTHQLLPSTIEIYTGQALSNLPAQKLREIKAGFNGNVDKAVIANFTDMPSPGYLLNPNVDNAENVSFSLFDLNNGKSVATFLDGQGTESAFETFARIEVTQDGQVLKRFFIKTDTSGGEKVFAEYKYGRIGRPVNLSKVDQTELNNLAQQVLKENDLKEYSVTNPLLPQPNTISQVKDPNSKNNSPLILSEKDSIEPVVFVKNPLSTIPANEPAPTLTSTLVVPMTPSPDKTPLPPFQGTLTPPSKSGTGTPTTTGTTPATETAAGTQTAVGTGTATAVATVDKAPLTEAPSDIKIAVCKTTADLNKTNITPKDLFPQSGEKISKMLEFLRTKSTAFDPTKFKDPMPKLVYSTAGIIYEPNPKKIANFTKDNAPLRKDLCALLTLEDGRKSIAFFVELPNPADPTNKDKNIWVILIQPLYAIGVEWKPTDGKIQILLDLWNEMNVAPIGTNDFDQTNDSRAINPLVSKTFEQHPDIQQIFTRYLDGDPTGLDGLVLTTDVVGGKMFQ